MRYAMSTKKRNVKTVWTCLDKSGRRTNQGEPRSGDASDRGLERLINLPSVDWYMSVRIHLGTDVEMQRTT